MTNNDLSSLLERDRMAVATLAVIRHLEEQVAHQREALRALQARDAGERQNPKQGVEP